jgi:hypothetical protein
MNERIIEMAIKAGFNPVNCTGSNVPLFEKFAQLIVRECIEWCDAHATINGTAQQIRDSIKKDFGVEE